MLFILDNGDKTAATFAVASDQASKLKQGKNKSITSFYENTVIIHVNLGKSFFQPSGSLVASFLCDSDVNIGVVHGLVPELAEALSDLAAAVATVDS